MSRWKHTKFVAERSAILRGIAGPQYRLYLVPVCRRTVVALHRHNVLYQLSIISLSNKSHRRITAITANMPLTDEPYDCAICMDTIDIELFYPVPDGKICPSCAKDEIAPRFEGALTHESQYPVTWGEETLDSGDYVDLLPRDFESRWRQRELEYLSPLRERVYCQNDVDGVTCGAFLWRVFDGHGTDGVCKTCGAWLCKLCGLPWRECRAIAGECLDAKLRQMDDARGQEFEGQVRGQDYQICPNRLCAVVIYLGEACNHMICPAASCRTHFCYLCGEKTEGASEQGEGHWDIGSSCPLYGHLGGERAIYFPRRQVGREVAPAAVEEGFGELRREIARLREQAELLELEVEALARRMNLEFGL
ncbi:IBR domain, a half RING-finger domain [Teratosphaeria destructans]|uniref:IBR domain, a half RING-finger domain n=1 Tax=Teratosphaeria destructans TaxID=418781 RepID=A0A9W7T131_9PEZI|nr:IBR domain, a half RING-finger domain [Teratosphaeria destructans]